MSCSSTRTRYLNRRNSTGYAGFIAYIARHVSRRAFTRPGNDPNATDTRRSSGAPDTFSYPRIRNARRQHNRHVLIIFSSRYVVVQIKRSDAYVKCNVRVRARGKHRLTRVLNLLKTTGPLSKPRATGRVFVRGREIVRGRRRSEGCTTDDGMSPGYGWARFSSPAVPPHRDNGILMEIRTPPFRIPARRLRPPDPDNGKNIILLSPPTIGWARGDLYTRTRTAPFPLNAIAVAQVIFNSNPPVWNTPFLFRCAYSR